MVVSRKGSQRYKDDLLNIPTKANRVLNVVLVGILLIVLRIWHLAVVQYDEKIEESRKPQRRVITEPAKRATIRDRFNIPLAINKVQYNVAVLYSQLKQIPTIAWETDSDGKRKRVYRRKEYISALSQLLGKELKLDPDRIEDLIHSKASFYFQIPFVLKEDITEREYYRLKMLEKDWLGISVQRFPRRHYPMGKVAGDIIGYMGAINRQEYESVIREIKSLEAYVEAVDSGEIVPLPSGMDSANQVRKRLKDLQSLAYTINDSVGKAGIEGRYESTLRGYQGKKTFYSDARGNFFRELPGAREPLSGKRLLLTISAELQEYAEQLLIQNERIRLTRLSHLDAVKQTILALKQPWIKGGAIVVMDPSNGDLLAMASIPRVDPNDFVPSKNPENRSAKQNIYKWLENEAYLAEVWNQQRPLEREMFDDSHGGFYEEGALLNWEHYLDLALAADSPLKRGVLSSGTLKDAITIQTQVDRLLELTSYKNLYGVLNILYKSEKHEPYAQKLSLADAESLEKDFAEHSEEIKLIKRKLDRYLSDVMLIYDQVLLVDMMRMLVKADLFSDELVRIVGKQTLSDYKNISASMVAIEDVVKKMSKVIFHETDFKQWRKENEKNYLKEKRAEEKALRKYAKPYIDYLDGLENEQFAVFWERYRWLLIQALLTGDDPQNNEESPSKAYVDHMITWNKEIKSGAHSEIEWANAFSTLKSGISNIPAEKVPEYLKTLRSFKDLDRPLLGKYRHLRKNEQQVQQEKHLAAAFYHKFGFGYGRSQAYRQASTQGSIFKLVTAYEALVQRYQKLDEEGKDTSDLNPLEIVDMIYHHGKEQFVGYNADGHPLPRFYKGGRLPRSTHSIGKVDLMKALETSSNPYFAVLAGDVLDSPEDLAKAARLFSYGEKTGIDLPGEISGKVPDDLEENRTGLYSMSIGQHTLVVTPLQTTVMLSAIANGGTVIKPKIVGVLAGKEPLRGKDLMSDVNYYPYQEVLSLVGIDFPLFVAGDAEQQKGMIKYVAPEIKRVLFMPEAVQKMLLDSMCRVVVRSQSDTLLSLSRLYSNHPEAISDYVELKNQLVGKTSTAESIENIDLDLTKGTNIYTHVWFGGVAYDHDIIEKKGPHGSYLFLNSFGAPEVVVVVYLRYGGYGKEAAPIAAQMVKKWREIKQKYSKG